MTIDSNADFLKEKFPRIWNLCFIKHIEAPGNYRSFKAPAVTLTASICEAQIVRTGAAVNIAIAASILARNNFPTYYVSPDLFRAIQHTNPPDLTWEQLALPFEGCIYMLPIGSLYEPSCASGHVKSREELLFVAYARMRKDQELPLLGTSYRSKPVRDYDRITVFWGLGSGLTMQDCTFSTAQNLAPDPEWIAKITEEYIEQRGSDDKDGPSPSFSSYIAGLIANLLLIQVARPELVERESPTNRKLKSGIPCYSPTFLGRKYRIRYEHKEPQGGHFTELRWRAGHYRLQRYGKSKHCEECGGKGIYDLMPEGSEVECSVCRGTGKIPNPDTKTIWIEPYMAHSAGLVRGGVTNG